MGYTSTCIFKTNILPVGSYLDFKESLTSLPHDKLLHQSKLQAFADDTLNVTKMRFSIFSRVKRNIVGKREIACTSNFSFSNNVFKRLLFQTRQKVSLCVNGLSKPKIPEKKIEYITRARNMTLIDSSMRLSAS